MKSFCYSALLLFVCASLPLFTAEAQGPKGKHPAKVTRHVPKDQWFTQIDQAFAAAKRSRRPVLVNFTGSDWCGWCVRLEREVFSKRAFKNFAAKNLVLLKVDFPRKKWQTPAEKKANAAFSQRYGVRGFPTIILMDGQGSVIAKTGYRKGGDKAYVRHLQSLLKSRR